MKRNVPLAPASMDEVVLPERVQEALGQLVGSAREGLLALSVGVGLGVLAELLDEEVVDVVGPKSKHNPDRVAVRHGHESGEVTLGGRRVPVEATALLSNLVERGLDPEQGILFVIDGAKAPRRRFAPSSARCRCSGAYVTRNEMCSSICPSASGPPSSSGYAAPGPSPSTPAPSSSCGCSPRSSSAPTPARPARCVKGWRRHSRSPGSASAVS